MLLEELTIEELKKMSYEQLDELASLIREEIIKTVSINGGHLASNLGVVELTIALHKVFDSPKDKLIFDVSHQVYAHKIITGRLKKFYTLRKFEGISGFSKYSESEHDAFEAGHSSTAISAGLGYLEAKKEYPDDIGEIIAIVGDASIANGLSFEGINYLGDHKEQKMIVIINDNAMGVSKNVGALARSYNNIRTKGKFRKLRNIIPLKIKKALKSTFYDINIFNSLGFQYFEKIDGHNIKELVKYLTYAKNCKESVVLHVLTTKGKGYKYSENDLNGSWHGVEPFNIETGYPINKNEGISFGKALASYLQEFVATNESGNLIRVITPAMALGSGLVEFSKNCSKQFIDVGLAEENATLMASSMSHAGLIPILFIYSTFLQRSFDELLHDIGRSNQHVILCIDRCGIVENDGDTHQGIFDLAYLSMLSNFTILSPNNLSQAISMLDFAINDCNGPVAIRYPKQNLVEKVEMFKYQPQWHIEKDGIVYVITYGRLYNDVKEYFYNNNINIGLVDANIIMPLDTVTLDVILNKAKKIVVYEEVIKNGSLGSLILLYINEKKLNIEFEIISLENTYLETGNRYELMNKYQISLVKLMKAIGE